MVYEGKIVPLQSTFTPIEIVIWVVLAIAFFAGLYFIWKWIVSD